jgi:DNA-binding MarR family transcriptional regulator
MPTTRRARTSARPAGPVVSAVELADIFGRTAKLLGARLADRLAHHALSVPRANVLVQLVRHGPMRVTELGQRVGISQGTASTLIEALTREGLAERRPDPADGRAIQIAATAAGQTRAQAWLEDYQRVADELFAPVTQADRPGLLTLLATLAAGIDQGPPT